MLMRELKHVHCIGIGGIGVSALAELLLSKGIRVSGSDLQSNSHTQRLERLGATILPNHDAQNIAGAGCVIYSSAVCRTNPEYVAAQQEHIPLVSRGEALAEFVNAGQAITIAGTHGKTTTTSLTAHVLKNAGLDPSYVIGGIMNNENSPVYLGAGVTRYFIAEVDESDASFLYMHPLYALITNIDVDHLEAYGGDFQVLQKSFLNYVRTIPAQGAAIVCIDDPIVAALMPHMRCRVITYGFSEQADVRAHSYTQDSWMSQFTVIMQNGSEFPVSLRLSGKHNVQNALAVIALAGELDVPPANMCAALKSFPGVGRRFHQHGRMQLPRGTAMIIEDYGHHPREIKVTLDAARMTFPNKRIVLVFQPHRYSRTRDLYQDFIRVLQEPDQLFLIDIYSAGEDPMEDITSSRLLGDFDVAMLSKSVYVPDLATLPNILYHALQDEDIVMLQGAGDIGSIAPILVSYSGE